MPSTAATGSSSIRRAVANSSLDDIIKGAQSKMTQQLSYTNLTAAHLRHAVEPWARVYKVRPGHQVEIVGVGGGPGQFLGMEQLDDGLTIYGYAGCTITVLHNGEELEA